MQEGPLPGSGKGSRRSVCSQGSRGMSPGTSFVEDMNPHKCFAFPDLTSPSCATTCGWWWQFHQRNLAMTGTAKPQQSQGNRSVQRRLCPGSAQEPAWLSGLRARSHSFPETVRQCCKFLSASHAFLTERDLKIVPPSLTCGIAPCTGVGVV